MDTQTIQPVLIYCDEQSIARQTAAVNNGLPYAQAVFAAFNAIPGIEPLTADDWHSLFSDIPAFIENVREEWYRANYATAHEQLGISQGTGMNLVADKLPTFDTFLSRLEEYREKWQTGNFQYASSDAFTVADGQLVIDQQYVDRFTNSAKLIFSTDTELRAKAAVDNLIAAIEAFNTEVPKPVFHLWNGGVGDLNLNQLAEVVNVRMKRFYDNQPADPYQVEAIPNLNFFKKLHGYVVQNNLA